jgi:hypothetical protein
MTLEQYANLFDIFDGFIVVITLIFLVIQLRQNTHALKLIKRSEICLTNG